MTSKTLTIGKIRGLQQIADVQGIFAMCAMDHRGSMQRMIDKTAPDQVTDETLIEYKRDLTELLAPVSTAVLLDPIYGAAQSIASGALPGGVGLLVSLEETGYGSDAQGRVTTLLPDWSVEKIKRMGASAVKLLLYYRSDLTGNRSYQQQVVQRVADDCVRVDIPLLVEPIAYPVTPAERESGHFAPYKPLFVIQSARDLTPLGVDVLKAEFPADLHYQGDEGKLRALCEQLDDASQAPWVLLSAGVTFDEFARQVQIACQAGASGFLGGRAIWEEAMHLSEASTRRAWLATVAAERMCRLHEIAGAYGRPWWRKWVSAVDELAVVGSNWYSHY